MFNFLQVSIIKRAKKQFLLVVLLLLSFMLLISGCTWQDDVAGNKAKSTINSKPSGLLLGIKSKYADDDYYHPHKYKPQYKTLYITNDKGNVSLITQGSGILVPRDDEFWLVNVEVERQTNTYKEISYESYLEYISVKKANGEPVKENNQVKYEPGELVKKYYDPIVHYPGMEFSENKFVELTFVGSDYISQKAAYNGYLGGAHGYATNSLDTMEISKANESSGFIGISELFGKKAQTELFSQGKVYYENHQNKGLDSEVRHETDWGLFRQNGKWVVKGFLGFDCQANRGSYAIFDTNIIPPKEIVSHDVLKPEWEVIKTHIPEAKDVFSSPEEDMLVVLTPEELRVYTDFGEDYIGEATYVINLGDIFDLEEEKEIDVIMVQWATGDYVAKWANEVNESLQGN
ncbi:MAG: hypothetical protein ACOX2N_05700 [Peptococcia bacterium]|jgi:hypothetical protein